MCVATCEFINNNIIILFTNDLNTYWEFIVRMNNWITYLLTLLSHILKFKLI